jgi:tripartite-type tricarboxylate transporter receptor subunit TctC
MADITARIVPEGRLRLAKSPTAELAAAALRAQEGAGLEHKTGADFIIIALAPGTATDEVARKLAKRATELTS